MKTCKRGHSYKGNGQCIECKKVTNRNWKRRNPDAVKGSKLIEYWPTATWEEALANYNALLVKQSGVCAFCNKHDNIRDLSVDHCHTTGKVRGLLCNPCNTALGYIKENFNAALNMAKYIQEHCYEQHS